MPIFQAGSASVSIVPDFSDAQKRIGAWFASQGNLHVGVSPDLNNADLARIRAELGALHGEASVSVDRNGLKSDLAAAVTDAFKGATGLFDFGAALSSAIGPAVKIALGGLGTELAAALAPAVTGGLALLPAALLGLAAPLAAVAVGVHGVSDAFKALGSGNVQQIQAAMDKLAPSTRDFVTQVHALGPAWTALRLDVQQNLFQGLGTAVTNLAHVALPVLRTGLSDIATSLNTGLVLTMKQLAQDGPQFTTIFKNVNTAVGEFATNGLPKLAQTFVTLASVGSQFLPQIVKLLDGVIGRFSDWVNRMNASGQLAQIMQNAIGILQQLFAIVGNVLGIVGNIFKAALPFGQALMTMLQQLTGNLKDFLGTDTAQSSLKLFFGEITNAVAIVLPTLQSLFQVIVTAILPAVGSFVQALAPLAAMLGGALTSALSQIAVLVPPLAQTLAGLIGAFAPLIPVISQIVLTLLPPLLQIGHALIPVISALTSAFGGALLQAVKALAPFIAPIADVFVQIIKDVTPLIPLLGQLLASILPPLAKAFLAVLKAVEPILPPLVSLLQLILPPLAKVLGFIIGVLGKELVFALQVAAGAIRFLVTAFTDIWKFVANVVLPFFSGPFVHFFTETIPHAWNTAWGAVRDFFVGIWHSITDWFEANIIHWFSVTFVDFFTNTIPNAFKTAWNGVRDFFKGLWTDLVTWFDGVLGSFGTFFTKFWTDLKNGVATVWHDILHALEVPVQTVINWVWNDTLRPAWNLLNNLWGGHDLSPVTLPDLSAATGAVLPGWSPGVDIHHFYSPTGGRLSLSGGEAVMRPEFTAAVGSGWVNAVNAAAISGGTTGVLSALGGMALAGGGIWPNPDWAGQGNVARGDRSLDWAHGLASTFSRILPLLPGGDILAPLVSYVAQDARAGTNQGGNSWFNILGAAVRQQANHLWDFIKGAVTTLLGATQKANPDYGNINLGGVVSSGPVVDIVKSAAAAYGWNTGNEWDALAAVINHESGFRNTAQNPSSTAYGIFQFLDSTWATVGGYKTSDPGLQSIFGLRYIDQRYHDPIGAEAHEMQYGWFDQGGYLPPGWSTVYNGTGRHEMVLNPQQQTAIGQRLGSAQASSVVGLANYGSIYTVDLDELEQRQKRGTKRALMSLGVGVR